MYSFHWELTSEAMFQINQIVAIFKLTSRCVHWNNSQTFFLGFQYKVLHLRTEIKDGIDSVASLLKATILHSD